MQAKQFRGISILSSVSRHAICYLIQHTVHELVGYAWYIQSGQKQATSDISLILIDNPLMVLHVFVRCECKRNKEYN